MEVRVKVRAGRNTEIVTLLSDGRYEVSVAEKPEGGRANERVRELIALHFHVPKTKIRIVKGKSSRFKVLTVGMK